MPLYRIQQKIKTLSQIIDDCENKFIFHGFDFKNWDYTLTHGCRGDAWIAEKAIEADDPQKALDKFYEELFPTAERLAFVSQCDFDFEAEPFLIYKGNPDKIVFIRYSEEAGGAPLIFNDNEISLMDQLETFDNPAFFSYLLESTKAVTHLGRLVMLVMALESLAEQTTKSENCACGKERKWSATDSNKLKIILADNELYEKIFGRGGVRHKLFHGDDVKLDNNYVIKIYVAIVKYFNNNIFDESGIEEDVVSPQRNFHGHYLSSMGWYRINNPAINIGLKELTELVKMHFQTPPILPNIDLEMVGKPDNY